jgi:hypothetical protein
VTPLTYPVALAVTLAVEVPVWTVLLRQVSRVGTRSAFVIGVGVNVISHPVFWFVLYPVLASGVGDWAALVLSESAVVAAETAMASRATRFIGERTPVTLFFGMAVSANLLSIAAGFLLQR